MSNTIPTGITIIVLSFFILLAYFAKLESTEKILQIEQGVCLGNE